MPAHVLGFCSGMMQYEQSGLFKNARTTKKIYTCWYGISEVSAFRVTAHTHTLITSRNIPLRLEIYKKIHQENEGEFLYVPTILFSWKLGVGR